MLVSQCQRSYNMVKLNRAADQKDDALKLSLGKIYADSVLQMLPDRRQHFRLCHA